MPKALQVFKKEMVQEPAKRSSPEAWFPPGISPGPQPLHSPEAGRQAWSQHQDGTEMLAGPLGSQEPRVRTGTPLWREHLGHHCSPWEDWAGTCGQTRG